MQPSEFITFVGSLGGDGTLAITRQTKPPFKSYVFINGESVGLFNTNATALEWLFYTLTRSDDEVN